MRTKFLALAIFGLVLGTAGTATAQNTNTSSNTNTNANSNANSNSNRGNSNRIRNSNRSNSNMGNSNTSNSNQGNSNTDHSNMTMETSNNGRSSRANASMGGSLAPMDTKFLMDAAFGNNAEIAAGQQALQKSSNPDVKRFAQMMIDHHTQANADLARMAPGVTLPTGLDPHHQAVADGHAKLSGMDFDMAYIKGQLADHAMTLDMLDTYQDDGNNKDLKSYAKKSEPMVKQHLSQVKMLDNQMSAAMTAPPARTQP